MCACTGAAAAALLLATPLHAGSFTIHPLRIDLTPERTSRTFTVSNRGEQAVSVQVSVASWAQDAGRGTDRYADTDELVFFPQIVEIAPDAERSVRVAYRGPAVDGVQRSYRVFIEELPVAADGSTGVRTTLKMSFPLFVTPHAAAPALELGAPRLVPGALLLPVRNTGTAAGQLQRIAADGRDARGERAFAGEIAGWYVLPGATREFGLPLDAAVCARLHAIGVEAQTAQPERKLSGSFDAPACQLQITRTQGVP